MNILIIITIASLGLSAAMGVLAWRVLRREQRRSDARIAALAADIDEDFPAELPIAGLHGANFLGAAGREETPVRSQARMALAAGALVVGTIVGLAVGLPGRSAGSTTSAVTAVPPASAALTRADATTGTPIELIALDHTRTAEGLTIRGVVRNPVTGLAVTHLGAVVLLFNGAGTLVATGRGAVDATNFVPGAEAAFAVSVAGASDVTRYRVSFRTDDDRVVPHVDKRDGA